MKKSLTFLLQNTTRLISSENRNLTYSCVCRIPFKISQICSSLLVYRFNNFEWLPSTFSGKLLTENSPKEKLRIAFSFNLSKKKIKQVPCHVVSKTPWQTHLSSVLHSQQPKNNKISLQINSEGGFLLV